MAHVRQIIETYYPAAGSQDDQGPWVNPDAEATIAGLVGLGYRVASTTSTPISTRWVRNLEVVDAIRLVITTTMIRD